MSSWGRTACAKRRRGGGASLLRTAPPFRHRLRRRHLPPQGRRLGSLRCEDSVIGSSTTEWGRLGGGGSQQRHPERSDGEA